MAIMLIAVITIPNFCYSFAEGEEQASVISEESPVSVQSQIEGASYMDGSFTGKGDGRNGDITVQVIIEDGMILDITAEHDETDSFWEKAKGLIDTIKNMGNPSQGDIDNIDAVSGATLSSKGIKEAVSAALAKAMGDAIFSAGEGTEQSPYMISNEAQLRNFAKSVNEGEAYTGKYIKLTDDINLSESEWSPIGIEGAPFAGHFDGDGKSVKNISIGASTEYAVIEQAGFFGKLSDGASVENITIDNAYIYVLGKEGKNVYGAALAAYAEKNNSFNKCNVKNSQINVQSNGKKLTYSAGIVSFLGQNSTLTNSQSDCDIVGTSGLNVYAGGLVGTTGNKALLMNNYAAGSVKAGLLSDGNTIAVGGIAGMTAGVTYNCYADNTVETDNENIDGKTVRKAGVVAWLTANGCAINNCYNGDNAEGISIIIFPEGKTFFEGIDNIKDKSAQEIADILHSNLSSGKLNAAKALIIEKAPEKDFGFEANLTDKVFYDWEVSGSQAALADKVWKETFEPQTVFESGTGTKEDPYILQTEEQLRKFAVSLSDENTYSGKYIQLNNSIELSDSFWTCIGEGEYPFCGTFDGNGHVVSGMIIKAEDGSPYNAGSDVYFGLFGVLGKGGVIKNLGVTNADIDVYGKRSTVVGGITALNDGGTVDSCYVTGALKGKTTEKGNNYAGGIVGWSVKGYVVNSYSDATVYSSVLPTALAMSGGIVGMSNRTIVANCYSLGSTSGYTKRQLEVVESMAAVGGLAGVAGSPVVNCYSSGDTTSEDYSFYVGAAVGWATGIAEIYDVCYNKDSAQTIQGQKISPVTEIGFKVSQGVNDEGETYSGSAIYNIQGKAQSEIQSQGLADQLNANFDAFPLSSEALPENIKLKKWIVKEGMVTFSDEYAERNFVEPDIEKPSLTGNYYDGIFYGRAEKDNGQSYLYVTIQVKDKKIMDVKCDASIEGIDLIMEEVLETNQVPAVDSKDSADIARFKNALKRAALKAVKGDYTNYKAVDTAIFQGGSGTQEDPYKISTAEQLVRFAASVNEVEHFKDKYIVLTNDIDLAGIQWVPAGGSGLYSFSGTFDGKGYKIVHMTIGSEAQPANYSCAGLFANINTATIKNLGITDGFIHTAPVSIPGVVEERTYAGMLVGYAGLTSTQGTRGAVIDNCYATGTIISDSVQPNYAGGLVGLTVHSLLSNSYSDCTIKAKSVSSWVYAGGLVGLPSFSIILNNYANGAIYSDAAVNKTQLGGIGGMYSSYAFNNYVNVSLSAERQTIDIGGIAGRNTGIGYISNCYGNSSAQQKSGDKVTTGINSVGSIVTGERYGKGQIVDSKLISPINQSFIDLLNQNTGLAGKDSMYASLVNEWFIYIPQDFKLNTWVLKERKPVFGAISADNSSKGGSSKSSGKGTAAAQNNEKTASYEVKATVSGDMAKAEIKLKDVKESKKLQIESSMAKLTFDEKALNNILSQTDNDLAARINILQKNELSDKLKDIVGDRPIYDISLTAGGKNISNFGNGTVNVEIPYSLREGENAAGIVVYYMDDEGKLTKMDASYNKQTKKVTFTTNHFSKYIVGYDENAALLNRFADISGNAWYAAAVQYAVKKGIMNGVSDTAFDPNAGTTRAMVCTILWNMEKQPIQDGACKFSDVSNNSWYEKAVIWSNQNGIAKGINESSFAPNAQVTREQLAQFLYSYAKYKGYDTGKTKELSGYQDRPSAWAEEAVKWAVGNEIINGKGNGVLDPKGTATRAEIAKMIMKFDEAVQ